MANTDKIQKLELKWTPKHWGGESLIINSEEDGYCGKILHFKEGKKFSMHFHDKVETWYCSRGSFILKSINTENAEPFELTFKQGEVIHVPRMQPHQLICLKEGEVFEVSTPDFSNDSYRIGKGDSQS